MAVAVGLDHRHHGGTGRRLTQDPDVVPDGGQIHQRLGPCSTRLHVRIMASVPDRSRTWFVITDGSGCFYPGIPANGAGMGSR